MKVVFTVLYLTVSLNSFSSSSRSCTRDPKSITMAEIENIVYGLAKEKGVPMTVILNRLLRKTRIKQGQEKTKLKNQLQEIALQELINPKNFPWSRPITVDAGVRPESDHVPKIKSSSPAPPEFGRQPSLITGAFYPGQISISNLPADALPSFPREQSNNMITGMLLPPGYPTPLPRPMPPSIFIPFQNLGPPPGVTIRVKAGINNIPEVTVTLSPMMTIVEALKEAESKFRSVLGLSSISDDDVISFSHSSFAECYVIRSFDNIESSENGFWKIIVSDISGKVIYDSVCLPNRNEVPVKPGMTITLLYTVV